MSDDALRWVRCYCGDRQVVTRRPPEYDYLAVCSKTCWEKRVRAGIGVPVRRS